VLLVDDEPLIRETVAEALEGDGLRVVTAADGREALQRVRDDPPDLVLLDLMLPMVDGLEVCRRLRELDDRLFSVRMETPDDRL